MNRRDAEDAETKAMCSIENIAKLEIMCTCFNFYLLFFLRVLCVLRCENFFVNNPG